MFGVGDYSFAPYKVAISGLHKDPEFRLVEPVDGRPTMLDDTCYFLPCRTLDQARLLEPTLNAPVSLELIRALIFRDAKRPVTKAVLQRVDLKAILAHDGLAGVLAERMGVGLDEARSNIRGPLTSNRPDRGAPMAFATINYFSRSLAKASSFNVVFPDDPKSLAPGRSSTCSTASPTTTPSGSGGPASSAMWKACRWSSSCPTAAEAGIPTRSKGTPMRTTSSRT